MHSSATGSAEPGVTVTIPNYQLIQVLGEGRNAVVYQAYRQHDPNRQPFTLKVFKDIYPSPAQQARFQHELRILQRLDSPYLVKVIDLEEQAGIFMLVSHYDELRSLRDWLRQTPFSIELFLKAAIHLAQALEDIHYQGVMHGDLKPSNILIDANADMVKLADFGMSRIFERQFAYYPESLEGTLPYISPEQTGRTNKPVDYRSDFYSLGVTLFQVATGRLPFETKDHLSLIHAHLAIEPAQASTLNPILPEPLSNLIARLMAKNPEDRYQGAAAIRADLEHCQAEWQATRAIAPFTLGSADRRLRFEVSGKLYGREAELKRLTELLNDLGQGPPALILVAGSAGIGKSSLIQALQPSLMAIRGMFVADKYDQYQRNIPYSALVRALQTLLRRLLREPADALQTWRERVQVTVGVNGRVISEVIPELELLLGPQSPVPTLPPEQAQGRFNTTFNQFLHACSSADQPLILFLDDLQWADDSSLGFLQAFLADPQPAHALIIGAYRDAEVSPDHRLKRLMTYLTDLGRPPYQINLTPLDLASVKQLSIDTLYNQQSVASGQFQEPSVITADSSFETLVDLLYQKSGGNPFFLTTLLQTLHDDGLLTPALVADGGEATTHSALAWNWDITAIQTARLSDNVVDLLLQKLDRLPEVTMNLLKQAACLGNNFQLLTLSLVSQLDFETLYAHLEPALRADFIREKGDTLNFLHDRVQEAVYQLLDEAERKQYHWQIGQIMLNHYDQQTLEEQLFSVVNQFNQGRSLVEDQATRTRLVELNYQAGLKARNSIAFEASLAYFQISSELLPDDSWQTNYSQTYAIWYELLMANILLSKYEAGLVAAEVILAHANSDLDRARCYRRLVSLHAWHGNFSQALEVGNQALALFGQPLPEDKQIARQAIGGELKHLATHLTNQQVILDLPEMTDPMALVQIEVRHELTPPLYRTSAELLVLNNLQMIRLALVHGSHPALSIAFVGSTVAMIVQGQLKQAAFFNAIATALWQRYPTAFETAQNVIAAAWSSPVILPDLAAIRQQNQWGQTLCKNVSNIYYWGASLTIQPLTELIDAQNLSKTLAEVEESCDHFFQRYQVERYRQMQVSMIEGYLKPLLNLETVDLKALEQELINAQFFHCVFHLHIFTGMLHYIFGDYTTALEYLIRAKESAFSQPAGLINPIWQTYHALTLLALAQETSNEEQVSQAEELLSKVEPLTEISRTFTPYTAFARAELAYTRREPNWHSTFFAAIDEAVAAEYTLLQAIIHERLAKHMLASGYRASRGHLEEALYLFEQCGAAAKVQQLKQSYAFYLRPLSSRDQSSTLSGTSEITSSDSQTIPHLHRDLDTFAILKASQAISSEIDLEKVLSVVMRTLGEVSGAESAFLILEQDDERVIQARYQARTSQATTGSGEGTLVRDSDLVSEEVVRYVHRTHQTLLLEDAYAVGEFTNDPYIQLHRVRSVLCQPIQEQNRLIGSIYLENNLSSHAFTPERVEVVRLLATQAAISITNAQAVVARTEQERVQRELEIARDVQLSLLPQETPYYPHFDIAQTSQSARQVSGDLYGYYQRPNGSLVVAVGDVTGKGMPAALLMSATVVALTGAIEADLSPAETLTRTDRVLQPFMASKQNVGICLAYLDQGQMCVANAGAIAPIVRNKEGTRMLIEVGGLPLGTHLSAQFPYQSHTIQLAPNDIVILTTDGLVEATNTIGKMYSFERFEEAMAAGPTDSAQAMLDYLLADWSSFVGQAEPHDDLTIVVIRVSE